jgi:hypothetical protein
MMKNYDWKEEALKWERDPHTRKIIINGPHGLSSSWCYQSMRRKYDRSNSGTQG